MNKVRAKTPASRGASSKVDADYKRGAEAQKGQEGAMAAALRRNRNRDRLCSSGGPSPERTEGERRR